MGVREWARAERFPEAARVLAVSTLDGIEIQPRDAVVLMTHSYEQDRVWLAAVLPAAAALSWAAGSAAPAVLCCWSEAAALLGWDVAQVCEHVFAPVGLDPGRRWRRGDCAGDGCGDPGVSCEGKLGHSQRMTQEMIAEQIAKGGPSRFLEAQCAL